MAEKQQEFHAPREAEDLYPSAYPPTEQSSLELGHGSGVAYPPVYEPQRRQSTTQYYNPHENADPHFVPMTSVPIYAPPSYSMAGKQCEQHVWGACGRDRGGRRGQSGRSCTVGCFLTLRLCVCPHAGSVLLWHAQQSPFGTARACMCRAASQGKRLADRAGVGMCAGNDRGDF